MPSMFDPIQAVLTPDMYAKVGERLGVSGDQVQKGTEIAIPLLARGVMNVAETPEGQVAIANAVSGADTSHLGNLAGFLGAFAPNAGDDLARRIFGDEARVVRGAIQESTGIDITPFIGMAGPLLLGMLNNAVQKEGLDTNGLVKKLKSEARGFARQKDDTSTLVDEVINKVDEVRKLRARFSADEWAALRNGPMAAAALVIAAAPSSANKTADEIAAALASVSESARSAGPTSLMAALFHAHVDDITAAGVTDAAAAVTRAAALVKATVPAEAAAYNRLLLNAAQAAAQAVKEGGFLGIGSKAVSKEEQAALDALAATLGVEQE